MKMRRWLGLAACLVALLGIATTAEQVRSPGLEQARKMAEGGGALEEGYDKSTPRKELDLSGVELANEGEPETEMAPSEDTTPTGKEPEKSGGFFKSKWVWAGGGALVGAGLGFLFGGPIGALIGAVGGGLLGFLANSLFM